MKSIGISIILAGLGSLASCSSSSGKGDTETHWLNCATDSECLGRNVCIAQKCVLPGTDAGEDGPETCALDDSWWAMMIEHPVVWGGDNTWKAQFTGTVRHLLLARAKAKPLPPYRTLVLDQRECGMQVPDYTLPDNIGSLQGMEVYGIEFPNAVWDNWTTDSTYMRAVTLTADGLTPGSFVRIDTTSIPAGAWSPTGLALADWPTDFRDLLNNAFDPWEQVDMDQDANVGVTGVPKAGPVLSDSAVHFAQTSDQGLVDAINAVTHYSQPIADISAMVPGDPGTLGRAGQIYYAFRSVTDATAAYSASLESCDRFSGTTNVRAADHAVLGCRLTVGAGSPGACTYAATTFLNGVTPGFSVASASVAARRIRTPPSSMFASDACDSARRVFAAEFPPTVP